MATKTQLKFYKVNGIPASGLTVGGIYFDKKTGFIHVATSSTATDIFGSKLSDAQWNANAATLSLTKADGTALTLDFSDMASKNTMESEIARLDGVLSAHDGRITGAQSEIDALEKIVGDGFSEASTVAAQLAAVKATADAAAVKSDVDSALALKADATKVAEDIAAAKTAAEGVAAADATKKADDAEAAAKLYADGLKEAIEGTISDLEDAYKAEDERLAGLIDDIVAAAVTVEAKDGDKYIEVTKATGENKYTVATKAIDGAIADAVAGEASLREAADAGLSTRIDDLAKADGGRVTVLESKVAALASATHFIGVKDALPESADKGDIVIVGDKEYIYDPENDPKWIELGDTTAEQGRISTLEAAIQRLDGEQATQNGLIAGNASDITALQNRAKALEDGMANYYTSAQVDGIVDGLEASIGANGTAIEALQGVDEGFETRIASAEGVIAGLDTRFANKADQSDFDNLTDDVTAAQQAILALEEGTGLGGYNTPMVSGTTYIKDATNLVAAAIALDAAIVGVQGAVDAVDTGVMSVDSGDAYAVVDNTDAANPKIKVNVAGEVKDGNTGIVTGGAVYDALCWVEFN